MSSSQRQIITTSDGSTSIYVPLLDENYHSHHGAINEAIHVFINSALLHIPQKRLSIFEVGYGTGLNALLTYKYGQEQQLSISYDSIEKYPLSPQEIAELNYVSEIDQKLQSAFTKMHQSEYNVPVSISDNFDLTKIEADIKNYQFQKNYDLIYFDAFAPNKQPSMWNSDVFQNIFDHCNTGAIFTTYCAQGQVRRDLQSVGFNIERIPGPPGKREMLRATKK